MIDSYTSTDLFINSLSESEIHTAKLAASEEFITVCENIYANLPSAEDIEKKEQEALLEFRKAQREWSDPVYKCPKCNEGGMCKEQHMMYASNPPCYKYKCDKCGNIEWRHI